jgi:hypothetical protein
MQHATVLKRILVKRGAGDTNSHAYKDHVARCYLLVALDNLRYEN